jgi:hypothetical protein
MDAKSEYEKMKQGYFAEFEKLGEDHVRLMLQSPTTGTSVNYKIRRNCATEWLAQFERKARLEAEAERTENKRMARSAKNAAWAAAIAAMIAAVAAIVSLVIAFSPPS